MRKILVVDDEKLIRMGIKSMLERKVGSNYEIVMCQNGREAIEFLSREKFHIMITDIRMPEMDGLKLLQKVKDMDTKPEIIVLSGYDDFNYAVEALKCGAKDYLLKPIQREQLYSSIDKIEKLLNEEQDLKSKESFINSFFEDFQTDELNYLFLNDSLSEDEIAKIGSRIKLDILDEDYYLGLILRSDGSSDSKLKEEIREKFEKYVPKINHKHVSLFQNEKGLGIIANDKEVFEFIKECFSMENSTMLSIGLSDSASGILQIKLAYNQAQEALKYRMLSQNKGTCLFNYKNISCKKRTPEIPAASIERLGNMIGTDREEEIEKLLSELLNENKIRELGISYLELYKN